MDHSATIVIPSYDRPQKLARCLAALAALDGGPWPVIVVDDGSPQPLETVCAAAGDNVLCIRQENAGPGAARNTGARAVRTRHVLYIDDDCYPRPDWALRLLAAQAGVPQRLVGGRIVNGLTGNVYSSASQSLSSYLYQWYQQSGSPMDFFTTNNMCCRVEDFLAVGGFDESFSVASEDRDLSLRWKDAGGHLAYAPDAVVEHFHDMTLRSYWRQHFNYGRGARHLHLTMDGRGDPRPKVESVRFYAGMLTHPLRHSPKNRLTESFVVGLSQVAMVAGYLRAIRDARAKRT